jgi:MOSC domain-containing protein YiiM
VIEITAFAQPCVKIKAWFRDGNFNCINQKRRPGWSRVYARVLVAGPIKRGDAIELLAASLPEEVSAHVTAGQ